MYKIFAKSDLLNLAAPIKHVFSKKKLLRFRQHIWFGLKNIVKLHYFCKF